MDAKSLKKLNRRELLELMVQISEENEVLARENEVLKAEIENRKLSAKEIGSLAQASLDANNYFVAAENAAKLYLENIARIEQETKERSSKLLEETLAECINMRAAAGFSADDLVPPAWGAEGAIETRLAQEEQQRAAESAALKQQIEGETAVPATEVSAAEGVDLQAGEGAEDAPAEGAAGASVSDGASEQDAASQEASSQEAPEEEAAQASEGGPLHAAPEKKKKGLFGFKKKS